MTVVPVPSFRQVSVRRVALRLSHRVSMPLTSEDERQLAREADLERGYDLPRNERSKRAYDLAEGAPVVHRAVRVR